MDKQKASCTRELDDHGEPTNQIEDKGDCHLMDCERYLWVLLGELRGLGEILIIPPYDPLSDLTF